MASALHGWRRIKFWALSPIIRLVLRFMPPESPWERMNVRIASKYFSVGSRHEFGHYFSGASTVPINGVDDIISWLLQAEYRRDAELFHEPDYWQHPLTFEQLRRGDCEDFALWAWRKLIEAGIRAEFYVGRFANADAAERGHAWVVCELGGVEFLLEAVARSREMMLRPLDDVRAQYVPHYSVNRDLRTSAYGGFLLDWHRLPTLPDVPTGLPNKALQQPPQTR